MQLLAELPGIHIYTGQGKIPSNDNNTYITFAILTSSVACVGIDCRDCMFGSVNGIDCADLDETLPFLLTNFPQFANSYPEYFI